VLYLFEKLLKTTPAALGTDAVVDENIMGKNCEVKLTIINRSVQY